MYYLLLGLTGGITALMVAVNGLLSRTAGTGAALILIHTAGLILSIFTVRLDKRRGKPKNKPSPVLFLPGLLGVLLTWAGIYCVNTIGVTLTLALRLFGQLLGSFAVDAAGIPGFEKRPLSLSRVLTLVIALAGCLIMADFSEGFSLPLLAAFGAGIIVSAVSVMNASLGTYIGVYHSVRINFVTGLTGSIIYLLVSRSGLSGFAAAFSSLPWYILIGGGVCGVIVVTGLTKFLPRVSILYSTLVLFLGQLVFGSVLDLLTGNPIHIKIIIGGTVLAFGLAAEPLSNSIPSLRKKRG